MSSLTFKPPPPSDITCCLESTWQGTLHRTCHASVLCNHIVTPKRQPRRNGPHPCHDQLSTQDRDRHNTSTVLPIWGPRSTVNKDIRTTTTTTMTFTVSSRDVLRGGDSDTGPEPPPFNTGQGPCSEGRPKTPTRKYKTNAIGIARNVGIVTLCNVSVRQTRGAQPFKPPPLPDQTTTLCQDSVRPAENNHVFPRRTSSYPSNGHTHKLANKLDVGTCLLGQVVLFVCQ